jgi:hypothetical protein
MKTHPLTLAAFILACACAHAAESPPATESAPPSASAELQSIEAAAPATASRPLPAWEVFIASGFPNPANVGVSKAIHPQAEVSLAAGLFSISPSASRKLRVFNVDSAIRYRIADGPFFAAMVARYQSVGLDTPIPLGDGNDGGEGSGIAIQGLYIVPKLGCRWMIGSRLSIGFDIGVQLPVIAGGKISVSAGDIATADDQAKAESLQRSSERVAGRFARMPIPNLTLFQLGWSL